jgi:hypothetical protein
MEGINTSDASTILQMHRTLDLELAFTCLLCVRRRYIKEGTQKFNSAFHATKQIHIYPTLIFESSLDI